MIEGDVLSYNTISPLPSIPISFSLNQSGSNGVADANVISSGAIFVDDCEEDDVEQSTNTLEWKFNLEDDFSSNTIIPPDSITDIALFVPDKDVVQFFIKHISNITEGRERCLI